MHSSKVAQTGVHSYKCVWPGDFRTWPGRPQKKLICPEAGLVFSEQITQSLLKSSNLFKMIFNANANANANAPAPANANANQDDAAIIMVPAQPAPLSDAELSQELRQHRDGEGALYANNNELDQIRANLFED